jgi:hypothetical protein
VEGKFGLFNWEPIIRNNIEKSEFCFLLNRIPDKGKNDVG